MHKVLVLGKIHEAGIERLKHSGGFEVIERKDNPQDLHSAAADADMIIVRTTKIDQALLDHSPRLKLVARHGVGYDAVDVAALTARNVPLALTGDVNSTAVAEHALALMLAVAKQVVRYDRAIREDNFAIRDGFSAFELSGRTLLIIGLGRIGRKVARLAQAFGMQVIASDPFVSASDAEQIGVGYVADWRPSLSRADFVSIHAPKLPDTRYLVGAPELAAMKPGSVLVNVSRGGMVDETALVEMLERGHLAGAGLDVFEHEPLPADDPLARHPGVVLSPHSAAFTQECAMRMSLACADNVISFIAGKLDPSVVVNRQILPN